MVMPTITKKLKPVITRWRFLAFFVLIFGLLLMGRQGATAAQPDVPDSSTVDIPSPEALRQLPLSEHPRLYTSAERFRQLQRQVTDDDQIREWYEQVKADADEYVADTTRPRHVLPDGKRLDTSDRVLERVRVLALVYWIEGDRRYAQRAWEELKTAASFADWNPSHFLDTAEMTHVFAIGYDWLYDVWTEEQRSLLRRAITEKGLQAAMGAYRDGAHWARLRGVYNWGQVTNGGIGLGALAVLEDRPEIASQVLHEAVRRVPGSMIYYAPDGGWIEGVHYWMYATEYTTHLLDALDDSFGTDFGISDLPGFSETGYFPIYMTGPSGRSFNHSDSWPEDTGGPQLFWMAKKFDHPTYAWYQRQRGEPNVRNLIWYDPGVAEMAAEEPDLQIDKYFEASHVALFRSSWDDPEALFLGFKGGDTDASHAHLDVGAFLLEALGVRWAIEMGADDYNVPGYFAMDTQRWMYYRTRAEGQNTLVIEPGDTPDQSITAVSEIERFQSAEEYPFAIADLTPTYADHVRSARRGVALLENRQQVLVQDKVTADEPVEAWWFMHTRADVQIGDDASTAVLHQDGKQLWAKLLTPASGEFTVRAARPLPESPDPEEQAKNEGVRKLSIHLNEMTAERVAVLLVPLKAGENAPETLPDVQPLEEW
jgi:hypothetical protein